MTEPQKQPEEGLVAQQEQTLPDGAEPATAAGTENSPPKGGEAPPKPRKSELREWAETIIIAVLVALVIKTFVVQLYVVDGPSMEPTLYTSDRLLVNKFLYRLRDPRPGEIVVLQDPTRPARELIKRVVATEGESIEVRKNVVYINGKELDEPFVNELVTKREDIPSTTVPAGHVYVMGDNRSWSQDSRAIGPIPLSKVDGKAFFMFWPLSKFGQGPLDQSRTYEAGETAK